MLLTLTCLTPDATDLSWLLHKRPDRLQKFDVACGHAHVFYPEASEARTVACLMLELDSVGLVRGRGGSSGDGFSLEQYVNDRPYAATSFLAVAIARVFGSALNGVSKEKPGLPDKVMDLTAELPVVPARGGEGLLRELFEPLGYAVEVEHLPLDARFPEWGDGPYFRLKLTASKRLQDLLTHLYVLLPVLDNDKHYWIGQEEVEKLLERGEGWLAAHPKKELITTRYLKRSASLAREALARLADEDAPVAEAQAAETREEAVEKTVSLNERRHEAVVGELLACGARRVLDLGCAQGKLLRRLLDEKQFAEVAGLDVSVRALEIARDRLDRVPETQRKRATLLHGSLLYRDARLAGFDAAVLVEVIEHLDPPRLAACERSVFAHARPGTVIVTTPNGEYNVLFESLPAGQFRHTDHRFEWSRAEFQAWAGRVAQEHGYAVRFAPVGDEDAKVGAPTQMAVFSRQEPSHV